MFQKLNSSNPQTFLKNLGLLPSQERSNENVKTSNKMHFILRVFMAILMYINREFIINSFMKESLSYRNQSLDLQSKSMGWFLCDKDLLHERVNSFYVAGFFLYSLKIIRTPRVIWCFQGVWKKSKLHDMDQTWVMFCVRQYYCWNCRKRWVLFWYISTSTRYAKACSNSKIWTLK